MEPTVTVLPDRDGLRVVRCASQFDLTNLAPLRTVCDTAVADGVDRLVLDVRGITFGDSTFLHLLLTVNDDCDLLGRLLTLTGTDQVLAFIEPAAPRPATAQSPALSARPPGCS